MYKSDIKECNFKIVMTWNLFMIFFSCLKKKLQFKFYWSKNNAYWDILGFCYLQLKVTENVYLSNFIGDFI